MARIHALSPVALPLRAYTFRGPIAAAATVALTATASLGVVSTSSSGSATVTLSETATVFGRGGLSASASIGFSETGVAIAQGSQTAATSIAFSASGQVFADGQLQVASSVGFVASATAQTGNLNSATSVGVGGTALATATGSMLASESLEIIALATAETPANYEISPLLLPSKRYRFSARLPNSRATTSIDFSTSAVLTGVGGVGGDQIFGSTSIADIFTSVVWLEGRGQLQGTPSIDFSESAALAFGRVEAAEAIAFGDTVTVTATGALAGSTSFGWATTGSMDLFRAAAGSETISLTTTGAISATGRLSGLTLVRFLNPGSLITTINGSTSFGFTNTGFLSGGDFSRKGGQYYIKVLAEDLTITVAPEDLTIRVAAERIIKVPAEDNTVIVQASPILEAA